jgi:hypothetical protein
MLDDAAKAKGSDVRVADVATLLAEATLAAGTSPPRRDRTSTDPWSTLEDSYGRAAD